MSTPDIKATRGPSIERSVQTILENQAPSGAIVACPNFEEYKYCWLRDGTFCAFALDTVGEHAAAERFYHWVDQTIQRHAAKIESLLTGSPPTAQPSDACILFTRYRMEGTEDDRPWGNYQLDGYGTWLWGLAEHVRMTGNLRLIREFRESIRTTISYLTHCWTGPNCDCWEEFGDRIHSSTLAAVAGGLNAINRYLESGEIARTIQEISRFLFDHAVVEGHFVKFIGSDQVEASLLWLAVPFQVIPGDHPVMVATVERIEELLTDGGVRRYPTDTYYGGGEWLLLASWLGWYHALWGSRRRARELHAWVEAQATPEGWLPEQVPTRLNAPEMYQTWVDRWGPVATPLIWSHAMHVILGKALEGQH